MNSDLDVKLGDFGHSRKIPQGEDGSQPGILIDGLGRGTNAFVAPEILTSLLYTPSIDIFALGATFFSILSLKPPYASISNPVQLLLLVKKGFFECGMNQWPLNGFERPCYFKTTEMLEVSLIEMIENCVHNDPSKRPIPSQLVEYFGSFLK